MIAEAPSLLVISDFDGTLAEFSPDPTHVPVNQRAMAALKNLSVLRDTTVAILSGRDRRGLASVSGLDPRGDIILAGSHGAESELLATTMSPERATALDKVTERFEELIADLPGAFVEYKPFHRVLHLMAADQHKSADIAALAQAVDIPGVTIAPGKNIVEAGVLDINKGSWIRIATSVYQPDAVIFLGDDTTDEDGFDVLRPCDLSVKVGEGFTHARKRVADCAAVADLLEDLYLQRQEFLSSSGEATV
ncbi:trehalose-phosphatase [Corynebacterium sp. ES2794-CONJ1]|uniref:trehalose-phosphatase n=1 Tax=unclassified Corynebacterium TaxID=2624378 RepID=UPI002167D9A3|nr:MULTISPECIES: trehalose-phosphatase [unclassified Corynebacterium]MCS4490278.1 trehalose-phosphatase [Corynebacterium sp. ES2775-CONJ]MCS4491911.1 trehalose-phosphatase [Corynebacterium sp. ES2715-CONJ3]MCS4532016.1 trehalose-phosphatase [Corynebacterium sp. ES2730-CONJ]MCU9519417.1 trehalose-phosphatase [Corynebacterium sp. ES2794-CONJ1]